MGENTNLITTELKKTRIKFQRSFDSIDRKWTFISFNGFNHKQQPRITEYNLGDLLTAFIDGHLQLAFNGFHHIETKND